MVCFLHVFRILLPFVSVSFAVCHNPWHVPCHVSARVACTHLSDTLPPCQTLLYNVSVLAKPDELVIPSSCLVTQVRLPAKLKRFTQKPFYFEDDKSRGGAHFGSSITKLIAGSDLFNVMRQFTKLKACYPFYLPAKQLCILCVCTIIGIQ